MALTELISRNWKKNDPSLKAYQAGGGYVQLKKALAMQPAEVTAEVKKSNLRGRGGAGFPTGMKWSFVPQNSPKPKYLCVNADESEPGTFKDRYIMELDPHSMLEGIAIACWALNAHACYVYIRGEYKYPAEITQKAIDEAYAAGIFGKSVMGSGFALDCYLVRGAGAYICGEETGLLESLEGKKGWPRLKPPFPAVAGLFGCPTVVNNVETLASLPFIFEMGAEKYAKLGTVKSGGTHLISLSGHVEKPGVYECSMATTLRQLIYDIGGGITGGRKLKAVIPGGSSAPVLPASQIDVDMEFEALKEAGTMAGSGAVIVMDDSTCMVRALWRISRFYAEESCGQCTPCREGTPWMTRLLRKIEEGRGAPEDISILLSVASSIAPFPPMGLGQTICALGDAAALPVHSFLQFFRAEFEEHIRLGRCPYEKPWGSLGEGRLQ